MVKNPQQRDQEAGAVHPALHQLVRVLARAAARDSQKAGDPVDFDAIAASSNSIAARPHGASDIRTIEAVLRAGAPTVAFEVDK